MVNFLFSSWFPFLHDIYLFMVKVLIGKKHCQIKLQRIQKLWIWSFGSLVHQINSFYEVLKRKQNFRKNKVVTGKTSFFEVHFVLTILFVLKLALDVVVLYGNVVFSILVPSTKRYSNFLKKIFVFQKICFKVKVIKTFKISTDYHWKTCRSLKRKAITVFWTSLVPFFRRTYGLSLGFKMKPLRKNVLLC